MPPQIRGNEIVQVWRVPKRGTMRGLPIYEVPEDAVWDARNVTIRSGELRPRPGFMELAPTLLGARPIGGINTASLATGAFQEDAFQEDAFQMDDDSAGTVILAATTRGIWLLRAGVWTDITDSPLQAEADNMARFTSIELGNAEAGSQIEVLHTNGVDGVRHWNISLPTVDVISAAPRFTDFTAVSDRILGVIPPYLVRWSEPLSITQWPALNSRSLGDTPDLVVAVRNLSTQRAAIYKTHTVWLATAQGGPSSHYWNFELRGYFDGPASPSAVVEVDGYHCYMTMTGRVALFDGFTHAWICDGIDPILEETLDREYARRIHGIYDSVNREVHFYYPRLGDAGECFGHVMVVLPRPRAGIEEPIGFVGALSFPVSAAMNLRHHDNTVVALRSTEGQEKSYLVGGVDDAGTPFSGYWQPGLVATPGLDLFRLDGLEMLGRRGVGAGTLTIKPIFSKVLEDEGGTVEQSAPVVIDLETALPRDARGHREVRGAFLGVRHEFTTPVLLRYGGTRLVARRVEPRG